MLTRLSGKFASLKRCDVLFDGFNHVGDLAPPHRLLHFKIRDDEQPFAMADMLLHPPAFGYDYAEAAVAVDNSGDGA